MELQSSDGMESTDGERLARWVEAGVVLKRRAPQLFRAFLRAHEATAAELSTVDLENIR